MHWVDCSTICRPPQLMRTICLSFGFLWLSFAGMAVSGHIWGVLLCTVLRSAGAAIIWVYSTLLLQLVVPNALLGRMMALELAFNTVCPCAPGTRHSCSAWPTVSSTACSVAHRERASATWQGRYVLQRSQDLPRHPRPESCGPAPPLPAAPHSS